MSFENSFVTVKILIKEQYEFVETGLAYVNDKVQYMQYLYLLSTYVRTQWTVQWQYYLSTFLQVKVITNWFVDVVMTMHQS